MTDKKEVLLEVKVKLSEAELVKLRKLAERTAGGDLNEVIRRMARSCQTEPLRKPTPLPRPKEDGT